MQKLGLSPRLVTGLVLAFIFGLALYLRVALPYDKIFTPDGIKFSGVDAYYHMRLVENLVSHFPIRLTFDPYTSFPFGSEVFWSPFFDWLLGGAIWLASGGSPSQQTIDVVGVYFPAVLAALLTIPVFFIGKLLLNRWAGLMAAGLVAVMPGELMGRSILGFTDHHIAEVLFSTAAMLFFLLALKTAREKGWTLSSIGERSRSALTVIYSLLAGIFLGTYLLTWTGALLFIFLLFLYFIAQSVLDYRKGQDSQYLVLVGSISLLVALLMWASVSPGGVYIGSLVLAGLTPPALLGLTWLLRRRRLGFLYYLLTLGGLGLAGLGVLRLASPAFVDSAFYLLRTTLIPGSTTIFEAQPILFPSGEFSFAPLWGNFTMGLFLAPVALGIVTYHFIRRGRPEMGLVLVWSLLVLAAMLGQRRFAYYFAVNIAVLTGYLSWRILELAGFKKEPREEPKKKAKSRRSTGEGWGTWRPAIMGLGLVAIAVFVFLPDVLFGMETARQTSFAPTDPWQKSLTWLRTNTPEPFGNADAYYQVYEHPAPGQRYNYPPGAYGVMAWWDYGHWITRIGRRLPNATPGSWGSAGVYFSTTEESAANKLLDDLGIRYVIADYATAVTKYYAVPTLAAKNPAEYFDYFYVPEQRGLVKIFMPGYYRSLLVRLYAFEGKAVTPDNVTVISYREAVPYKEVTGAWSFPSYQEAESFVNSRSASDTQSKYRIAGVDPLVSPIPLEALTHYRLLYSTGDRLAEPSGKPAKEIKIFEYTR